MTRHVESDDGVFAALRSMWTTLDPVPPGLDGSVFALVDAELIASDIALLELVEDIGRSPAVRGGSGERTLRFTDGAAEVLVRIAPALDGARIDGWAVPAADGMVRLRLDGRAHAESVATSGRFEFARIASGSATLWFEPNAVQAGDRPAGAWKTPPFTI